MTEHDAPSGVTEVPPARHLSRTIMKLTSHAVQCRARKHARQGVHNTTGGNRFPHSNFKYFLTLFSKFFSSFPHGTCSLSVSHQYLALDGIYHQIRAAFPSNSTLRMRVMDGSARNERRDSHPLRYRVPTDLHRSASRTATPIDYNSQPEVEIFKLSSSLFTRRY